MYVACAHVCVNVCCVHVVLHVVSALCLECCVVEVSLSR